MLGITTVGIYPPEPEPEPALKNLESTYWCLRESGALDAYTNPYMTPI